MIQHLTVYYNARHIRSAITDLSRIMDWTRIYRIYKTVSDHPYRDFALHAYVVRNS